MSLLEVSSLSTVYRTGRGPVKAVDDVSFSLERGTVLGIVGESGCGKTTLAMSLLRLIRPPGKIVAGSVVFEGENLFSRPRAQMRELRGARLSLVPQAAMNALDPAYSARVQVAEVIRAHRPVPRREAAARAGQLLESLGIPSDRIDSYPHELSGGMRQRVSIALALANDPVLVIADEPMTGLDVIVQAQILDLMSDLRRRLGLSMIFISHDLLAVAKISDELLVMYAGQVVERGTTAEVIRAPRHPYTRRLLASLPRLDGPRAVSEGMPADTAAKAEARVPPSGGGDPPLRFVAVEQSFQRGRLPRRGGAKAVDGVTLHVDRGEALGLIGESGSGKTTLARLAVGLIRPDRGRILFEGRDLARCRERDLRDIRRSMHLILQDPYDSLSPRMRVSDLVAEPMVIHRIDHRERGRRVLEALEEAGLAPATTFARRYPHELSGGQRQRVALARALVLRPRLIVADEPTSMLDVSLQAGLLATMQSLRERHGITFLFITHDLALARYFCDRLAVMLRGRIVEVGSSDEIVRAARHPYTRALMQAVRDLKPPPHPAGLPPPSSPDRGYVPTRSFLENHTPHAGS